MFAAVRMASGKKVSILSIISLFYFIFLVANWTQLLYITYLHCVVSMRMLSWVVVCMGTLAVALSL